MRSKGSHGVFAPTPFPSPAAGEGPSGQIAACSTRRLGSVTSCYRFAVTQHKMRRRPLESVSSRSLSVRGSWGTAPSVFWYGVPGGTQGPLGKGGAAERWRVTPSVSWVTRHGAQPATTRTHKRNAPAASRTGFAPCKINATPKATTNLIKIGLLPTFLHRKADPRRIGAHHLSNDI